jgi:hypothetical protein
MIDIYMYGSAMNYSMYDERMMVKINIVLITMTVK